MNPLELRGPEFLQFYFTLFVAAFVAGLALRWFLRQPGDQPSSDALFLSPYEVAYLGGGAERAVDTAIARLVREEVLVAHGTSRKVLVLREAPHDGSELHRVIHDAAQGTTGQSLGSVRSAARPHAEHFRRRLEDLELVVAAGQANLARILPLVLVLLVPALGAVKIAVGVSRGRPVGFLVMACAVSVFAALAVLGRPILRSRRGDFALLRLRERNAALETQAKRRADQLAGDDVVLAFGLFGAGVFTEGPMSELRMAMRPQSSSDGSSSWSSCGSSGCGGGGGGGCGGCGGG